MRIDYNILKNIEEWYGSDDFEVGDVNEKENPRHNPIPSP